MKKLIAILGLAAVTLLAACGGGGGDPGEGPRSQLRMTPLLSQVGVSVGYFADVAKISQGAKPYFVLSSDPSIYAELLEDNTLRLYGMQPGTSTVAIQDSSAPQRSVELTVTAYGVEMGSSAGDAIELMVDEIRDITISGGVGPFHAESTSQSIVRAQVIGDTVRLTGLVEGSAKVRVTDSLGGLLEIQVGVKTAPGSELEVLPGSGEGRVGQTLAFFVHGGKPPYTPTVANASVASASLTNNTLSVWLLGQGATTIVVSDSSTPPKTQPVSVSVQAAEPTPEPPVAEPAFGVVPPSIEVPEDDVADVEFMMVNGEAPFIAQVNAGDAAYASASIAGTTLTVTRPNPWVCVGQDRNVNILVYDGKGKSAQARMVIKDTDPAVCP